MLSLPSRTKMFLCIRPVDMRKSFDGLFGIVQQEFQQDPRSGHLFLFVNKRRDRMKAMFWDADGFVLWYKRLEQGTWQLPVSTSTTLELEAHELALMLRGIDLQSARQSAAAPSPTSVRVGSGRHFGRYWYRGVSLTEWFPGDHRVQGVRGRSRSPRSGSDRVHNVRANSAGWHRAGP